MLCPGGPNLTVHNGWQSLIRPSPGHNTLIAVLPPPGFGCDNDKECLWFESCTSGRNVSVPFCGACNTGTRPLTCLLLNVLMIG
jgi:hypothetical protein